MKESLELASLLICLLCGPFPNANQLPEAACCRGCRLSVEGKVTHQQSIHCKAQLGAEPHPNASQLMEPGFFLSN